MPKRPLASVVQRRLIYGGVKRQFCLKPGTFLCQLGDVLAAMFAMFNMTELMTLSYRHNGPTRNLLLPEINQRLIKEISDDKNVTGSNTPYRWQRAAIGTVQEAAEAFLVREFESKSNSELLAVFAFTHSLSHAKE
jgi:hypothetical protein